MSALGVASITSATPASIGSIETSEFVETSFITSDGATVNKYKIANLDKIIAQWREAQVNSFENWSFNNSNSPEELQALLKHKSTVKVGFHTSFEEWARINTDSPQELQALMRKSREGKYGFVTIQEGSDNHVNAFWMKQPVENDGMLQNRFEDDESLEFAYVITRWRKSQSRSFTDWARNYCSSPKDLQELLKNDGGERYAFTTSSFEDWAQNYCTSVEELQDCILASYLYTPHFKGK